MRRLLRSGISIALISAASLPAQGLRERSERVSTYKMTARLQPADRAIHGTQEITWRNTTGAPTSEVQLHLYINAFRDLRSTFMKESDAEFRELWRPHEFGSIQLNRVILRRDTGPAVDLTLSLCFIQPDDGNVHDATVAQVPLPAPVAPGESIVLETQFTTVLPKAYRRTGYIPDAGFFCMHWYPKLGVLEERDGEAVWNCHQFHANSEFFADFSVYDVELDVPGDYEVGATGQLRGTAESSAGSGRKTLSFYQEDVHDFAWVADPDFVRYQETFEPVSAATDEVAVAVAERLGVPVEEFDLPSTEIILLLRPEHDVESQRRRHFEAVKCALWFFGLRFGQYPYPSVTAVDPGRDVLGRRLGGGMEYPMLITCGTTLFPDPRRPRPEGVTVHEFGHQYWYGLSANNEFEESWLDEGINSYSEGRAQWLWYAEKMWPRQATDFGVVSVGGIPGPISPAQALAGPFELPQLGGLTSPVERLFDALEFDGALVPRSPLLDLLREQPQATYFRSASYTDAWNDRDRWLKVGTPDSMVRLGWQYVSRPSYVANSYHRPATLLRTLERMVGRDEWWTFMRRFHALSRFQHPTTDDFVWLLTESCGPGPAAFFDNAIRAGADFDYGVESVAPEDGRGDAKEVVIRRYGAVAADVQVRFTFEGMDEPVYRAVSADDFYPLARFRFEDTPEQTWGRLLEVWVDPPDSAGQLLENPARPAGVYLLDANMLNNGWRAEASSAPALYRGVRLLLQAQTQLSYAGLIG